MQLTAILPTYNERGCLEPLAPRLERALAPYDAEILVVDDASPDGTAEYVREHSGSVPWRLLERPARSGLASAVRDGFDSARGEVAVVLDADGSHPPETIASLVDPILEHRAEMVLASRELAGGSNEGLVGPRRFLSWGASWLARPLVRVSDPMSGYFAVRRSILPRGVLAPIGYKIGLEVLVKCHPAPVLEVPFRFAPRIAGESKLTRGQVWNYARHVVGLYLWRLGAGHRASSTR